MKEKLVYVSINHKNIKVIRSITNALARANPDFCILNPRLSFSHLENESYMENSLALLDMCDEMWVLDGVENAFGYEIEYCREYKIPISTVRGLGVWQKAGVKQKPLRI